MKEEYYLIDEVAKQLRVSRKFLYDEIRRGKLKTFRIGIEHRISETALQAYIKGQSGCNKHEVVTK